MVERSEATYLNVADWLQVVLGDVGEGGGRGIKAGVQEHQVVGHASHLLHEQEYEVHGSGMDPSCYN